MIPEDALREVEEQLRGDTGIRIQRDVDMKNLTSLRLGGKARMLCECGNPESLRWLLRAVRETGVPLTVMGNGSNLLVLDGGIPGVTLRMGRDFSSVRFEGRRVFCQAGCLLSSLSRQCVDRGLSGLVFASGIPGSVGGAAFMNAGAYGGEMKDVLRSVRLITYDGEILELKGEEMALGYRTSAMQRMEGVITEAVLDMGEDLPEKMRRECAELARKRAEKQPLDVPSAGSTFRRPEGAYAAQLIEQCGLKGFRIGQAWVSEKHAGFLVNRGTSSRDFLFLMETVRRRVHEETGYLLEPEIRILGVE